MLKTREQVRYLGGHPPYGYWLFRCRAAPGQGARPLLVVPAGPVDVAALTARTADAWLLWHHPVQHRTDVGRILPRLVTDARIAARVAADRAGRRAVLAEVYALVQHEVVWASEAELTWTAADRAMSAAQDADTPAALAGAAWTLAAQPVRPRTGAARTITRPDRRLGPRSAHTAVARTRVTGAGTTTAARRTA